VFALRVAICTEQLSLEIDGQLCSSAATSARLFGSWTVARASASRPDVAVPTLGQ
jgi:hypothetical protein